MMLPRSIQKFIEEFSKLPSIGPRMATRLAFYLINESDQDFKNLEESFIGLKLINRCPKCFFIKENKSDLCRICSDESRNKKIIAVVEKETDLMSLEKSGSFVGNYLIIGESSGRGSLTKTQKMRIKHLKSLIDENDADEAIIATNPTAYGDFLTQEIKKEVGKNIKITRLGRGLPTGGEIEFADEETLGKALEGRK